MTKEKIQERLALLRERQAQLTADLNAYTGAIQDCEYWLSVLEIIEQDKNNGSS